jgi:predicted O-linked N-acetylglucosamine transferase (SPINDLY family)
VDHWLPTSGLTDDQLTDRIRTDAIDILVDLAGHTAGNRLGVFARKPTPVSLHWLDFGYTTGLTAIDYYLTDNTTVPAGSECFFSETPWRIETPALAYRPPAGTGPVSDLPAQKNGFITFGTLTRAVRINHRTIRVWSEILRKCAGSRLIINSGSFKDTAMQDALAAQFILHGIERERLDIGCLSPPWDVLRDIDISLDCFPHNSGTTLIESLYMGVPYITLADRPSVGRLGSAILEGVGRPEWIALTEDEYIMKAAALAEDLPKLAAIRSGLREDMAKSPLMDEPGFAGKIEAAYKEMFTKWCLDIPSASDQKESAAIEKSNPSFDELLPQALSHHQSGRLQEAENLYLTLLQVQPDHPVINYNLGILAMQRNQPAAALPYFEAAIDATPEHGAYWLSYIDALAQNGQSETALQVLAVARQSGLEGEEVEALATRLTKSAGEQPTKQERASKEPKKKSKKTKADKKSGNRHGAMEPTADEVNKLVTFFTQGHLQEAETTARAMIARYPKHGFSWKILGPILKLQGQPAEALSAMRQAIALLPNDYGTHYNMGIIFQDQGKHLEAETSYRQALKLHPQYPEAYCNLGFILNALEKTDEAERCLRLAIQLKPDLAEAYNNLGNTLKKQGKLAEAEKYYRQALQLNNNLVVALSNLGNILKDQHRLVEAETCYRQALKLKPDFAEVHYNLGNTLRILERLPEAEACFSQALELKPDFAEAHNNMGVCFKEQGLLAKAEESYHHALELNPQYAEAHSNLGSIFSLLGRIDEAETSLRRALELKPDYTTAHSNLLFLMNYHPDKSGEEIFQLYKNFNARFGLPFQKEWQPHKNSRDIKRRLKIGYVNPQFCQHPVQYFLEPLLAHHDKSKVEVYAYAEIYKEDTVTERYKMYVDHWIPTTNLSDTAMVERIRLDGIDILIDIAGHTGGNRLQVFARKPAPVSLHWLDFGYTTGLTAIDYYLADSALVPPGSEGLFAETPWRLATPSFAYRPAPGMGEVSPLPARERGQITFGTLTRVIRINHRTIRVWAEILKRVPGSRLIVDSGTFKDPAMQSWLMDKFKAHGIDQEQLEIGCHSPPWDVLRQTDIGLDCFPHNSGTTLFETLYMGVPFITLADRPSVGRLGCSILEGVGHPEWIAQTEDEYIEHAVTLASDLSRLGSLRAGLRQEMEQGPLMDEPAFARKVEAAYEAMFAKWCEEQQ